MIVFILKLILKFKSGFVYPSMNLKFCLCFLTGLIVGAVIRYLGNTTTVSHLAVVPEAGSQYNSSLPPDTLWLHYPNKSVAGSTNKTYAYVIRREIVNVENNEIDLKVSLISNHIF